MSTARIKASVKDKLQKKYGKDPEIEKYIDKTLDRLNPKYSNVVEVRFN